MRKTGAGALLALAAGIGALGGCAGGRPAPSPPSPAHTVDTDDLFEVRLTVAPYAPAVESQDYLELLGARLCRGRHEIVERRVNRHAEHLYGYSRADHRLRPRQRASVEIVATIRCL
jgi:hypothetical protein